MPTPTYTIQRDPPWVKPPPRVSTAPTASSVYTDDYNDSIPDDHPADVPPLKFKDSYHPSYHAHPQQEVNDYGPQVRQSRLPIFKQVRSMLHKPPPITTPGNPKWDEYTGELSEDGKPSSMKPSNYTSPYDGAFKALRKRSPDRPNRSKRNLSPVSVLRDEEIRSAEPMETARDATEDTEWSPVSPVSPVSPMEGPTPDEERIFVPEMMPEPLSPNVQRAPPPPQLLQPEQTPPSSIKQIKRKPVSRCTSATENHPPPVSPPQHSPSQSQSSDMSERMIDDKDAEAEAEAEPETQHNSHFSWTTYAPSIAPARQSTDTTAPWQIKHYPSGLQPASQQEQPNSRFSWSTVATNQNQAPPDSPPPPVPAKFSGPPMQSILSRRRPIQRIEKEEWVPPPRDSSRGSSRTATPRNAGTPTSAHTARPLPLPKDNTPKTSRSPSTNPSTPLSGGGKALPLPPSLSTGHNLTHLETLLAQERSILLQRKNVEKGILDLEKIEKASPLDVPFATVRDAKKRLADYRARLAEVRLEERDIGIAIARARRRDEKENGGDGESLWVRRITG